MKDLNIGDKKFHFNLSHFKVFELGNDLRTFFRKVILSSSVKWIEGWKRLSGRQSQEVFQYFKSEQVPEVGQW